MRALYMLPFDHRQSFVRDLFGWSGTPSREQTGQVAAVKQVIYEGLLKALDAGVPRDAAALLVDERFGHGVLADAHTRGIVTACPAEMSGRAEFEFQYGEEFASHLEAIARHARV